jgi:ribonuclease HIII
MGLFCFLRLVSGVASSYNASRRFQIGVFSLPTAKYSLKAPPQRRQFKNGLFSLPATSWSEKKEQYCDYRLDGRSGSGWLRAKQFNNGTLYLEASDDSLLSQMTALLGSSPPTTVKAPAAPSGSSSSSATPEKITLPSPSSKFARPTVRSSGGVSGRLDISGDYIGTDESGKGDYFGPLVIAGVHITDVQAKTLTTLGVMDSKKLTDARIDALAAEIFSVVGEEAIASVELDPTRYNAMYAQYKASGKNLNHLLAWGHATVLEALLERFPDCKQAIADQFGNERYILSQLQSRGQGIHLQQTPRAEANVGVAAASVIARWRFVHHMKELSTRFGMTIPLGAGPAVKATARRFKASLGEGELVNAVKLHFKTTSEL